MGGPPTRDFVSEWLQDLQPAYRSAFHLCLHLRPHSADGQGTRTSNSRSPRPRTVIGLASSSGNSFSRALPLKGFAPELYLSSGEEPLLCFSFN